MTDNLAPLELPADYNPATFMCAKITEYGTFHESRRAARLGAELVANGAPEDLALAHNVLRAALACQETDERDPHVGNFYWMAEDSHVEDLNAVEFVLESLIPMLLRYRGRLSVELESELLASIRLGLAEIARLDVLVAYTNITALDVLNTCLGAELLEDKEILERGARKLLTWITYISANGHPLEYNSPTYTAVTLRALKRLADFSSNDAVRAHARALAARLGLSVALHIQRATGRWAGPHGRAYQPSVVCETAPEIELVRGWLADGTLPGWIGRLLEGLPEHFQVDETAERELDLALSTYQAPEYALGTASRSFNGQANVCMAHYRRPDSDRPGVFYTRYILNDKWFGDAYHATDRTKTRNLPDEGEFFSVQHDNRALCVYSPGAATHFHSAKAALIWTRRQEIEQIWAGGQPVTSLPHHLAPGEAVEIVSGDVHMAIRPLSLSALGKETPLILVERDGDLVLEIYNYSGVDKRFWELGWPGAFFQGRPFCAFYVEIDARARGVNGPVLSERVAAGAFDEKLDPPYTFGSRGERGYRVAYRRDGHEIGLDVDLMQWRLRRRWTEGGLLGWPALSAPFAVQAETGPLRVGEVELACDSGSVWLLALPETGLFVGGYLGDEPTDLRLATGQQAVTIRGMEMGTVTILDGQIQVAARYKSLTEEPTEPSDAT